MVVVTECLSYAALGPTGTTISTLSEVGAGKRCAHFGLKEDIREEKKRKEEGGKEKGG